MDSVRESVTDCTCKFLPYWALWPSQNEEDPRRKSSTTARAVPTGQPQLRYAYVVARDYVYRLCSARAETGFAPRPRY